MCLCFLLLHIRFMIKNYVHNSFCNMNKNDTFLSCKYIVMTNLLVIRLKVWVDSGNINSSIDHVVYHCWTSKQVQYSYMGIPNCTIFHLKKKVSTCKTCQE